MQVHQPATEAVKRRGVSAGEWCAGAALAVAWFLAVAVAEGYRIRVAGRGPQQPSFPWLLIVVIPVVAGGAARIVAKRPAAVMAFAVTTGILVLLGLAFGEARAVLSPEFDHGRVLRLLGKGASSAAVAVTLGISATVAFERLKQ